MEPLTPQDPHRIGPYRLLARLGEGGMGAVYLARSDRARTVAVKTIQPRLAREPDFRRRFAREITAARRVGGQWTAPVLDADIEADTPWVATGYIAGPSLRQVVFDHGPLPERSVLLLAGGLAQALKAIHGAGLVHRDLKPSNVLLTIDGPRVIDFGIARAMEAAPGERITRTGATVGSPGFMSPEQVEGRRLTPASDVFGLGSLLAFAATGRTPFGELDTAPHVLMYRTMEEEPELSGVPEALAGRPIAACLAKDPAERPPVSELLGYPAPGGEGAGQGSWLPTEVLAQLGREAISLLDSENPKTHQTTAVPAAPQATEPSRAERESQPAQEAGQGSPPPPPSSSIPSPYDPRPAAFRPPAQQPAAPRTPGPSPSEATPAFGPPPPPQYGGIPGTPPNRSRRGLLIGLAAAVALAVIGTVAVVALSGGDGDDTAGGQQSGPTDEGNDADGGGNTPAIDNAPIDDGYLGAWQGEYGTPGQTGWKSLWFEVRQGPEGENVGTATVTYMDAMCVYEMRLDSFDDQLNFTEAVDHSVPEDEARENCRADGTVQSLQLQSNGDMRWTSNDQQTTLQSAGDGGGGIVPGTLVGSWYDSYYIDEEGTAEDVDDGLDEVSIQQGSTGETVLRWSWHQDEVTCVTENELARVDGDRILVSPDVLVEEDSTVDDCEPWGSYWAWTEDDGSLRFLEASDPDGDPYEIYND
jgi:eukaryotic-like serine/threonine-protein kinase